LHILYLIETTGGGFVLLASIFGKAFNLLAEKGGNLLDSPFPPNLRFEVAHYPVKEDFVHKWFFVINLRGGREASLLLLEAKKNRYDYILIELT